MDVYIFKTQEEMGEAAARQAAQLIHTSIQQRDEANIILATGTSQFSTIEHLVQQKGIDWSKVNMFHLSTFIGLPSNHPGSPQRFLTERFISKVGPLKNVYFINGEARDPQKECERLGKIIASYEIDVALLGIGENGHIAVNDPPADFETEEPFIIVNMEINCRRQQLKEGWFQTLEEVPTQAISMSIRQIMKSRHIIVSVPEERKAIAVKNAIEGIVTNMCPASILQEHPDCKIYLDEQAALLLTKTYNTTPE